MFQNRLSEIGADFPDSLIKNLDRSIITMHPKYKKRAAKSKTAMIKSTMKGGLILDEQRDIQSRKFPGLSVPDQEWKPAEKYLAERAKVEPIENLPTSISVDDTMAELAAVASRRDRPLAEDYLDGEPSTKRLRYGNDRNGHLSNYDQKIGTEGFRENSHGGRGRIRPVLDERPVLYKIYDGTVQNLRDFGAFVSLEGILGRVEGEILHL